MALPGKTPASGMLVQYAYRIGMQGATESWAKANVTDIITARAEAVKLKNARRKLMGYGVHETAIRVALLPRRAASAWLGGTSGTHFDTLLDPYTEVPANDIPGRDLSQWDRTDQAVADVKILYRNDTLNRTKITNHAGVPDNVIQIDPDGPLQVGNGKWFDAVTKWVAFLVRNQWGWIGRVRTVEKPIISWGTDIPSGNLTLTLLTTDANFVQNDLVLISKIRPRRKGDATANGGPYQIKSLTPAGLNTVIVLNCTEGFTPANFCYMGYVREYALTIYNIESHDVLKQGGHRRGIPFGLSRGRRKTRA